MFALDQQLFLWINAGPATPAWVILLARLLCDAVPGAAGAMLLAVAAVRRSWRQPVATAIAALLLAWVAVRLLRAGLPMPRPALLGLGTQWADQGTRPGFPSMHAATLFAFAAGLLAAGLRGPGRLMLLLATIVALCRVVLGLHFPSDVAAGALLGTGLGWLVARAPLPRLRWRRLRRVRLQAPAFFSRGTRPIR